MVETSWSPHAQLAEQIMQPARRLVDTIGGFKTKAEVVVKTLAALPELRGHDHMTSQELKDYQARQLNKILRHALQHSAFYQEHYKDYKGAPFRELPPITKTMLRDNFDKVLTVRDITAEEVRRQMQTGGDGRVNGYRVITTSGSTGEPMYFVFNPREWIRVTSSLARARECAGLIVDPTRKSPMAVIATTNSYHLSAAVGKDADTPFIPTLRMDAASPMMKIVEGLNGQQPEVLVVYASVGADLARLQKEGKLHISPKKVITSSEVLTPDMREIMEEVWGEGSVYNLYAATETATIAAQRPGYGTSMHLFENLLYVENVTSDNKPVPEGELGDKLLVTVFGRTTMPLIRYEVKDSVKLGPVQPGLPYRTVEAVQGRQSDILNVQGIRIHPVTFTDVLNNVPCSGWKVLQEKEGIKLLIVKQGESSEEIQEKLSNALRVHGVRNTAIKIEPVEQIPRGKNGKLRLIQSSL